MTPSGATKVALITGGSRGIGAATALLAASRGYDVCFTYASNEDEAEKVHEQIEDLGRGCLSIRADVTDHAKAPSVFNAVERQIGRVDLFVNNAGIINRAAPLVDTPLEDITSVIDVNLTSAIVYAREAAMRMRARGRGLIVNMSSAASHLNGAGGFLSYGVSKAGIDLLTRSLATELGPDGVRVNAVAPGIIDTDMQADTGIEDRIDKSIPVIPLRRAGVPQNIAATILWLASDEANYITGEIVRVTGGR